MFGQHWRGWFAYDEIDWRPAKACKYILYTKYKPGNNVTLFFLLLQINFASSPQFWNVLLLQNDWSSNDDVDKTKSKSCQTRRKERSREHTLTQFGHNHVEVLKWKNIDAAFMSLFCVILNHSKCIALMTWRERKRKEEVKRSKRSI